MKKTDSKTSSRGTAKKRAPARTGRAGGPLSRLAGSRTTLVVIIVVLLLVLAGVAATVILTGRTGGAARSRDNALKLARLYAEKGEFDQALKQFDQLDIDDPAVKAALEEILGKKKAADEALRSLDPKAAQLAPVPATPSLEASAAPLDNQVTLIINHPQGLHARPAAMFVQTAKRFQSEIRVRYGQREVDAVESGAIVGLDTADDGVVRVTRPVEVRGTVVKDARFTFKAGRLEDFSAREGFTSLRGFVETDPGARMPGEIALVAEASSTG